MPEVYNRGSLAGVHVKWLAHSGRVLPEAKKGRGGGKPYTPDNHAINRILQIQYLTPRIDLYLFTQITQGYRLGDFCNRSDLREGIKKIVNVRKADYSPEM